MEENEKQLNIKIEWAVINKEQLSEIIKEVSKIQKEYSCNCTLNVNLR